MRSIEFDQRARRDLMKLRRWLVSRAPSAADRAIDVIMQSVGSLGEFPDRGRRKGHGMRELYIPFGAHGYVVQYRQQDEAVVIARIRHSLERR